MLKRIAIGAAAGALAVGPMTGVLLSLNRTSIAEAPGITPNHSEGGGTASGMPEGTMTRPDNAAATPPLQPATIVRRAALGAGVGASFGLVTGIFRPTMVAGLISGLALWKASADRLVPPLDVLPPDATDAERNAPAVAAAYAVFGLVLGGLVEWVTRRTGD